MDAKFLCDGTFIPRFFKYKWERRSQSTFLVISQLVNQRRWVSRQGYPGDAPPPSLEEYKAKVMNVCKAFDKIPSDKVR